MPRALNWSILLGLLAALLVGAVSYDFDSRPGFIGDEATYAMQAASLAWDGDLRYERADFDRFVEHWHRRPEGLILQSRDGGKSLTFGKPPLYATAIAPFVRVAPRRGPLIANVLFLAAAAVLAVRTLERRLGDGAALWVAAALFASVAFAYAFWIHADLFMMSAVAAALALAWGGEHRAPARLAEVYEGEFVESERGSLLRWAAVGALLGVAAAGRPLHLALLLPVGLATPVRRRGPALAALALGCALVLGGAALWQWGSGGSWSAYAGERRGFYERTGFPEVDFPGTEWPRTIAEYGNSNWVHRDYLSFELRHLWGWNLLYFLVGRNVGVLPYYLPLLLGLAAFARGRGRGALLLAVAVAVAGFFVLRPFNFFGGTGAIGNRYFLPLYPALWFLWAKPRRAEWALVAAAAAAPFLYSLWLHPRAHPLDESGRYSHVSPVARRWLPYETTQSHIPGGRDVSHRGLWIKFLNDPVWPEDGGRTLRLLGGATGELLIGSERPLVMLGVEFESRAPSELVVEGGEVGDLIMRPSGGVVFQVRVGKPRARHPMWWTWKRWHLYRLDLAFPQASPLPLVFTLNPVFGADEDPGAATASSQADAAEAK